MTSILAFFRVSRNPHFEHSVEAFDMNDPDSLGAKRTTGGQDTVLMQEIHDGHFDPEADGAGHARIRDRSAGCHQLCAGFQYRGRHRPRNGTAQSLPEHGDAPDPQPHRGPHGYGLHPRRRRRGALRDSASQAGRPSQGRPRRAAHAHSVGKVLLAAPERGTARQVEPVRRPRAASRPRNAACDRTGSGRATHAGRLLLRRLLHGRQIHSAAAGLA